MFHLRSVKFDFQCALWAALLRGRVWPLTRSRRVDVFLIPNQGMQDTRFDGGMEWGGGAADPDGICYAFSGFRRWLGAEGYPAIKPP
jgi:hypothetical protein